MSPVMEETIIRLTETYGDDETRTIAHEVARRMGPGGYEAEWLRTILAVVIERHPELDSEAFRDALGDGSAVGSAVLETETPPNLAD